MVKFYKEAASIALSCLLTTPAFASYVGIEAIQTNLNYKSGYGQSIFKKNVQMYNLFAGVKFTHYVGVEFGYEYQPERSHSTLLTAGQTPPGFPTLTVGQSQGYTSNIRGYHPYLGLFGEYVQKRCWLGGIIKYQALLAASLSEISANDSLNTINGITQATPITSAYTQHKVVALVKLSATDYITKHIGIRLSVDYHSFNEYNIPSGDIHNRLKVKGTFGIGLGIVYALPKDLFDFYP